MLGAIRYIKAMVTTHWISLDGSQTVAMIFNYTYIMTNTQSTSHTEEDFAEASGLKCGSTDRKKYD